MSRTIAITIVLFWGTLGSTAVQAATINVPGDYGTIQEAIDAAAPGDTVLVADENYPENIDIDVEGLTLISVNGRGVTAISSDAVDTPIVTISANGVTLGMPGQAFLIRQFDAGPAANPHSGNAAVRVLGDQVHRDEGKIIIQNNRILGNGSDEGVLINPAIDDGHLIIQNNDFGRVPNAAFGFKDAMHFHWTDLGGEIGRVSLLTSNVELLGNTALQFDRSAVYFHDDVFDSKVKITSPDFTAAPNPNFTTYGVYFNRAVRVFSSVDIVETHINDVDYGVYVGDDVESQSELNIIDSSVNKFHDYGVYVSGYVTGLSTLRIDPTVLAGDGNAGYGVYLSSGVQYGSSFIMENSEITGFDDTGIYIYDIAYGSEGLIHNNVIEGSDANTGLYTDLSDGSSLMMTANKISGFDSEGVYLSDQYPGTFSFFDGNTLNGDQSTYGFYFGYGPNYGSMGMVSNNVVEGFTYAGLYDDGGTYNGSVWDITGNRFTAHGDGADYGIYLYEISEGSAVTIADTNVERFTDSGLYVDDEIDDDSHLTVMKDTFTAHADGADYGVYLYYGVEEGSSVSIMDSKFTGFDYAGIYLDEEVDEGALLQIVGNTFTAHADGADYGVYLSSGTDEGSTTRIQNNTIVGFDDYGLYLDDVDDGSDLFIQGNTLTAHPDGAEYGIYIDDIDYGSKVLINPNTVTGFTEYGLYLYEVYGGSTLTVDGNTFTAHADGAQYGIYQDDSIDEGSQGVYTGNTISGFTEYGAYIYYVEDGSEFHFDNNTLTAHTDGADYGLYNDGIEYGSIATINGNVINGIKDDGGDAYGMYIYDSWYGSSLEVNNNTIRPHADGASYGIWFDYPSGDGSLLAVNGNDIQGFSYSQLYFDGSSDGGAILDIKTNRLEGGMYGLYFDDELGDGFLGSIFNNSIAGFDTTGIHFDDNVWGADLTVELNRIIGGGTDAGLSFAALIEASSQVQILSNCFRNVPEAVRVQDIMDTSRLMAHQNDFGDAAMGINNVNGDADHRIDAANNYWGTAAAPVQAVDFSGEVRTNPFLAQAPDVDGDGASLCGDKCPGTPAAQSADADGCSCQQLNPGDSAACLVVVDEIVDEPVDLVDLTTGPGLFQPACCGAAGIAMPMMMVGYVALLAMRRKRRA